MSVNDDQGASQNITIDLLVRLGVAALLAFWAFRVVAPLVSIGLWSVILAVALYPFFEWSEGRIGSRLSATLVTALSLLVVLGPVTWLGLGVVNLIGALVADLSSGQLALPLPAASIKTWPIIGERLHQLWFLAVSNLKVALTELLPMLKPIGGKLLQLAQDAFWGILQLLVSIVIAGFLLPHGPKMADGLAIIIARTLSLRGKELVNLAGATVRNVTRGVIGIALLQALLGGAGFFVAGIPAASGLAFIALLLGILQIGPAILFLPIVVWSWTVMAPAHALMFTAYMVPVGLIDNILRPLLMARGLDTPMPVIVAGVIGGMITYGLIGLFVGPVILSVAWAVLAAWVRDSEVATPAPTNASGWSFPTSPVRDAS